VILSYTSVKIHNYVLGSHDIYSKTNIPTTYIPLCGYLSAFVNYLFLRDLFNLLTKARYLPFTYFILIYFVEDILMKSIYSPKLSHSWQGHNSVFAPPNTVFFLMDYIILLIL
jgi:hypothetical protein